MEYTRQKRSTPPSGSFGGLTKKLKSTEQPCTQEIYQSEGAFSINPPCDLCQGNQEYITILKHTLSEVFQQNEALKRKAEELERKLIQLTTMQRSKQNSINLIEQFLKI